MPRQPIWPIGLNWTPHCTVFIQRAGPLARLVMVRMAKTSPAVLLCHRSYANHGTGVTVWPLLRPSALLTSVPKRPTRQARHPSVLPTLRPLGPAASPVVCRLADHPPVLFLLFHYLFPKLSFIYFFLSVSVVPRDLGLIFILWPFSCY